MDLRKSNRRAFIRDSIAVAATTTLLRPGSALFSRASAAEPKLQPIRLGGPSFAKTDDPEALALAHRALTPGGHVVLRDGGTGRTPALATLLAAQGFSHIRCRVRPSGAVLTADLPFFGPIGGR